MVVRAGGKGDTVASVVVAVAGEEVVVMWVGGSGGTGRSSRSRCCSCFCRTYDVVASVGEAVFLLLSFLLLLLLCCRY